MARMIDADALTEDILNAFVESDRARDVIKHIQFAPTVDAVPVVRCKDCLYYSETIGKDSGKPCGYGSCCVPGNIIGIVYDENFCSYGERGNYGG